MQTNKRIVIAAMAAAAIWATGTAHGATTGFNQDAAGPWDYNTPANWVGGTAGDINGIWDSSLTLLAAQTVTFGTDTVLGGGLSFQYDGAQNETLRSDGVADRTLTLGGDILHYTVSTNRTVTFGSSTANQKLNIDLGGTTRTFDVRAAIGSGKQRALTFVNNISNGGLILKGGGNVNLSAGSSTSTSTLSSLTLKNIQLSPNAFSDVSVSGALTIDGAGGMTAEGNTGGISIMSLASNSGRNHVVSANSLARANGGIALFRGTNLGSSPVGTNNTSNITFANAPTAQLVGGGGAAGSTNISILPWAVGGSTTSAVDTFVTYDANGIRPLNTGTEFAGSIADGTVSTNNIRLVSGSGTATVNGNTTINSLFMVGNDTTKTEVTGSGTLTITSGAILMTVANTNTTVGVNVEFGSRQGVIGYGQGKATAFTGAISGSGGLVLYQTAPYAGTWSGGTGVAISGNAASSTYTGDTYVLGRANIVHGFLPSGTRTGDMYVVGILETNDTTFNGLNGSGIVSKSVNNDGTLTIGDNNANGDFSGVIQGRFALVKNGNGTQILGGASTYTRTTTVNAGKLLINGSTTAGAVTVNAGTLGGTGFIGGNVTVANGATLAPGASIESLEVAGNAVINGTLKIELSGTGAGSSDLLIVGGILDITNATVDFDELVAIDDASYVFATYGTLAGDAFAIVANLPTNYQIDYGTGSNSAITLTLIPEPASMALLAMGGLLMIRRKH